MSQYCGNKIQKLCRVDIINEFHNLCLLVENKPIQVNDVLSLFESQDPIQFLHFSSQWQKSMSDLVKDEMLAKLSLSEVKAQVLTNSL